MLRLVVLGVCTATCVIGAVLQYRQYERYVERSRKRYDEALVYLQTDVCTDDITLAALGRFHRCDEARAIRNESPKMTALYELLNDWHPCGHDKCAGMYAWFMARIHWILIFGGVLAFMAYTKYVDLQKTKLFADAMLPRTQYARALVPAQHVD